MKAISIISPKYGKYIVFVDDEDYETVIAKTWCLAKRKHTSYAFTDTYINGKRTMIMLHRFLLNAKPKTIVDHRDGNGLNNQKCNLRICAHTDNMRNCRRSDKNTSGFKGVHFSKGKWRAMIRGVGKKRHIGLFDTKIEAAEAYNIAAKKYHGEFAKLNPE